MKTRIALLVVTALAIPASFIAAPYPSELVLQHVPTVLGVAMLLVAVVRFRPSSLSYFCCLAFLWLHIIGARWIYSFVPYDDLAAAITGHTISEAFGWERNCYDRFVHLASGLLGVAPVSEYLQSFCGTRPLASAVLGVVGVLAMGACYEVLEWQIAVTFSPAMAEAYNGQQGDMWDPQKDLALAGLGGILAAMLLFRWSPKSHEIKA